MLVKDLFKMLSNYYNINIDTLIYDATLLISPMTKKEDKRKKIKYENIRSIKLHVKIYFTKNKMKIYELQYRYKFRLR